MGMPQADKFLEAMFIGVEFRFDQQSKELERIKTLLCRGISVQLTPTDLPDGNGGESRPEVVASFFVVSGEEYRSQMRSVHGDHLTETRSESVLQLGVPCDGTRRIMEALTAGCNVYLIPEEGDGIGGRYVLCVLAS